MFRFSMLMETQFFQDSKRSGPLPEMNKLNVRTMKSREVYLTGDEYTTSQVNNIDGLEI